MKITNNNSGRIWSSKCILLWPTWVALAHNSKMGGKKNNKEAS